MPVAVLSFTRRQTGRVLLCLGLSFALAVTSCWFLLTSPGALVPPRAAPNAEEVGAGRDAFRQLRGAKGNVSGSWIALDDAQLAGVASLASHALRPDRLSIVTAGPALRIEGSHQLPWGRWLNVTAEIRGPSSGFPATRLTVGAISLPPLLSRMGLELGRWLYVHLRSNRADIPPISRIAKSFAVRNGKVIALVSLGTRSGVVDDVAGIVAHSVDREAVARIYCTLAKEQKQLPSGDFAEQIHRAFAIAGPNAPAAETNAATFIALGLLLVDERVADFAGLKAEDLHGCWTPPIPVSIYGRFDWPKHWTLSAVLAVGAGTQLSEAAGEWKELADSLAHQSRFAVGDPTGFSMADLAADRAGFQFARAATQAASGSRIAQALAKAGPQQLLPHVLIEREDGLSNTEFVRRYGGLDDPRFKQRVRQIDSTLAHTAGILDR